MDLTIIGQVLRSLGDIYILVALVAVTIALIKPVGWKQKAIATSVVAIIFGLIPAKNWLEKRQEAAFSKEAWAYFKRLCDERSGEKIYKTYRGVKSVLVIKPLPPATEKDLYDQFWYGDPYSAPAHSRRGLYEAAILASPNSPVSKGKSGLGLEFVEVRELHERETESKSVVKLSYPEGSTKYKQELENVAVSRFAVTWEDISTPEERKFWIASSRLRVLDLSDQSVIGERIGFLIESGFGSTGGQRRPWLASRSQNTTCPYAHDWSDRWFVLKVLNPNVEASDGK